LSIPTVGVDPDGEGLWAIVGVIVVVVAVVVAVIKSFEGLRGLAEQARDRARDNKANQFNDAEEEIRRQESIRRQHDSHSKDRRDCICNATKYPHTTLTGPTRFPRSDVAGALTCVKAAIKLLNEGDQ